MNPFPGELLRSKDGCHPYVLTEEQEAWLRATFPVTENSKVKKAMGISYPTLYRMTSQLGIRKTVEGIKAIRQRKCEEHKRINRHYKMLLMSGQKITRCTNLRVQPYTMRQIDLRCSALNRGYLLDEDISEGSPGRYAIYYDDETTRSARFEETCKRHGLRVEKD